MTDLQETKTIASVEELNSQPYQKYMADLHEFSDQYNLKRYDSSRIWEYPWIWFTLQQFETQDKKILDIGSNNSPFPWYLSKHGFNVVLSDNNPRWWLSWIRVRRKGGFDCNYYLLDARNLAYPTCSVDVYLSVSVIEHIEPKKPVLEECARVLKPGGYLVITFDIHEPDMGMSFPGQYGRALSMNEFDEMIRQSKWFSSEVVDQEWDTEGLGDYREWHQTIGEDYDVDLDYVTGAAVVQRNDRKWKPGYTREKARRLKRDMYLSNKGRLYATLLSTKRKLVRDESLKQIP